MQTQTSNTLYNAIMEAGGKDRPSMLAPDKEVLISEGSSVTTTETYMENYKNVSQDIRDQPNDEAEAVQIILTGIDNDIYSTVDACPNACEMWKAIERLKHGESINVQDLETILYWEFGKFTSWDGESLESYYSRSQYAATRNREKTIVNSPPPIYDQEPSMVAEDDEMLMDKEIDKLMALISLSFKKIYKPTNNNLRTSSNTSRANQDNSPWINRGAGYDNQRLGNVDGARETVGTTVELEAHYMYMAQIQEVFPDAADFGPIFDTEPVQKMNRLTKMMSYDREQIDQNDDDVDLANERELLASLIEKLKCEIDDNKNRNKFLETSNKVLVEKLKGVIPTASSRPQLKSNPMEDRVLLNNSQGNKQEVEDHRRNVKFSKNKMTKLPIAVPVSTREPKRTVKQSVAKPLRKTVASESNQKPRNTTKKIYERISKACSWWYPKFTPPGYK
nr:hypothetical protein [Tanacetum cinerariifolium]